MARILDFYDVRWEYEPDVFPILWNLDGDVVESFTPDFWLPDLGLYLEMTTLRQRLVRRKNRKLRRVRELYPDLRVKLFYARDFRALMLKYGKLALAAELSGTVGQMPPVRPRTAVPAESEPGAATVTRISGHSIAAPADLVDAPAAGEPPPAEAAVPSRSTLVHRAAGGSARRRRARRRSARGAAVETQTPAAAAR